MSEIKLPEPEINTKGTDGWLWWPISGYTTDQMRAAILEERERCAKLCQDRAKDEPGKLPTPEAYKNEAMLCAAAIRSQ